MWIVALLVAFPPVGIFLLYRFGLPIPPMSRHVVAGAAAVWCVILIAAGGSGGSKDGKETPAEPESKVTASTTPTPSTPPSTPGAPPTETTAPPTATATATTVPSTPVPDAAVPAPSTPLIEAPRTTRPPDPDPDPATETTSRGGGSVYYANCDEAKRAGAAPIRIGQPGYRAGLDRDKDGVACDK